MKVNFTKVKVRPSLFEDEVVNDYQKQLANIVWQNAQTVEEGNFALRLFNAPGDLEISDSEADILARMIATAPMWQRQPVLEILGKA